MHTSNLANTSRFCKEVSFSSHSLFDLARATHQLKHKHLRKPKSLLSLYDWATINNNTIQFRVKAAHVPTQLFRVSYRSSDDGYHIVLGEFDSAGIWQSIISIDSMIRNQHTEHFHILLTIERIIYIRQRSLR